MSLVECVPNFSEGRDRGILDAIAAVIRAVDGVKLLDVDPGSATNRTVFTFVGPIESVERAAFAAIQKAATLIDMRSHRGEHPRLGATDVCPFVPLGDTTMQECVALARRVGRRVGADLGIPVFLYERAAASASRVSLSDIRKGEYEGLDEKLKDPTWAPDFGPATMNVRSGATVIGAREFLIAYNVNLDTRDRRLANIIAQNIRETGRPTRGADGRLVKDAAGQTLTEPGPSLLPATRATGWYIDEYGRAQVSINLTDYKTTPPHRVFQAVEAEAARLGLRVTGSEVVGLIPLEAVRMAGRDALSRQGRTAAVPEPELIHQARLSLGLDDVSRFEPSKKIIEYMVKTTGPLSESSVRRFVDDVSSGTPAPGGGSVAALAASLSAALCAMVAAISYERKGTESKRESFAALGDEAHALKSRMIEAIDADSAAFTGLMAANRMPRATKDDRQARDTAIQEATLGAIEVPLAVMKEALRALELAGAIAESGAEAALSDAGVAAQIAAAAVEGACYNVRTNLSGLTDRAVAEAKRSLAEGMLRRAADLRSRIADRVSRRLGA